ncbi:Squamous cell carcinoma-related oncogene 3 [Carabus blaptoides fortunei]
MGNCFTCFKVPPPAVQHTVTNNCHKEEMPEARLYSAPSHVAALSSADSHQQHHHHPLQQQHNNGNTKPSVVSAVPEHCASLSRFYPRRTTTRTTSTMGNSDSKSSETKLNTLFDVYKDTHEDLILAEGIEQLCADLQVSPDEFRVLVFAWKLNAEQMCRFTRAEFVQGCRAMHVDTVKAIQGRLPEICTEVEQDGELFKDLYRFTFRFGLDVVSGQRILPTDMAVCLWRLVFSVREPPILTRWLRFLEMHPQFRGIPRDTWNMFLNFSESVGEDLSSYDDTEAWPSLFDDFVEYENDQMNQNISNKGKECDSLLITNEH